MEELKNCQNFPDIHHFHNTLTGENISDENYFESKLIYNKFAFPSLKEYMEAYCLIDVYLLAEVFTKFRHETLKNFEVDPCNFVSLPGMGLECFLKKSQVELDYIYNGNFNICLFIHNF